MPARRLLRAAQGPGDHVGTLAEGVETVGTLEVRERLVGRVRPCPHASFELDAATPGSAKRGGRDGEEHGAGNRPLRSGLARTATRGFVRVRPAASPRKASAEAPSAGISHSQSIEPCTSQ